MGDVLLKEEGKRFVWVGFSKVFFVMLFVVCFFV